MQHQELLDRIRDRAGAASQADARAAAEACVAALAGRLNQADRNRLVNLVPGPLRSAAETVRPGEQDRTDFLTDVAQRAGVNQERARVLAQAVLSTLRGDARERDATLPLPVEFADLANPPGPGGGIGAEFGGGEALTDDEVAAALAGMPQWTGDARRISRVIALPEQNLAAVLDHVREFVHSVHAHVDIDRVPDGARVSLWTQGAGGVTRPDIRLATRVDDLIARVSPLP